MKEAIICIVFCIIFTSLGHSKPLRRDSEDFDQLQLHPKHHQEHLNRLRRWSFWPFSRDKQTITTTTTTTEPSFGAFREVTTYAPVAEEEYVEDGEEAKDENPSSGFWGAFSPIRGISNFVSKGYKRFKNSTVGQAIRNSQIGRAIRRGTNATRRVAVSFGRRVSGAVRAGYRKIKRKLTGEQKYDFFVEQVREGVSRGDKNTIAMLERLGINVTVSNSSGVSTYVRQDSPTINEILENEGLLNPNRTNLTPTEKPETEVIVTPVTTSQPTASAVPEPINITTSSVNRDTLVEDFESSNWPDLTEDILTEDISTEEGVLINETLRSTMLPEVSAEDTSQPTEKIAADVEPSGEEHVSSEGNIVITEDHEEKPLEEDSPEEESSEEKPPEEESPEEESPEEESPEEESPEEESPEEESSEEIISSTAMDEKIFGTESANETSDLLHFTERNNMTDEGIFMPITVTSTSTEINTVNATQPLFSTAHTPNTTPSSFTIDPTTALSPQVTTITPLITTTLPPSTTTTTLLPSTTTTTPPPSTTTTTLPPSTTTTTPPPSTTTTTPPPSTTTTTLPPSTTTTTLPPSTTTTTLPPSTTTTTLPPTSTTTTTTTTTLPPTTSTTTTTTLPPTTTTTSTTTTTTTTLPPTTTTLPPTTTILPTTTTTLPPSTTTTTLPPTTTTTTTTTSPPTTTTNPPTTPTSTALPTASTTTTAAGNFEADAEAVLGSPTEGNGYFPDPFESPGEGNDFPDPFSAPANEEGFPDIFNSNVRDRLREVYERGDFSHDDLKNAFNFDPNDYHYYYDYVYND
ncbi:hypothetical protein FHG87_021745 [Trinorchestia longiramus]|nr:hypothetical protein FHG87_021745 [Trinorchestia longiramus]